MKKCLSFEKVFLGGSRRKSRMRGVCVSLPNT
jgi:hypothetical protein